VEFLGRSPRQDELLSSKLSVPPSMAMNTVRTSEDGTLEPNLAMQMLKEGNERFAVGAPLIGKVNRSMREALALKGQAPHTAIVGCADSRVPLETVFDALPGDLFVLRNAGNTCTHAEGSILGSLEFCTGALNTQLIFVLGHTNCGALKGATSAFLSSKESKKQAGTNWHGQLLDILSISKLALRINSHYEMALGTSCCLYKKVWSRKLTRERRGKEREKGTSIDSRGGKG